MKKLLIIGGATGSGKSDVAVQCAKKLNGEIISADSMQIYKYMNVGTAKITQSEMQGVRHHMLDVAEPMQEYSVRLYRDEALNALTEICNAGKTPIVAGGTGLYINSLIYDMSFSGESNSELRSNLKAEAARFGNEYVHAKLAELDASAAERLHVNDLKRVIRAIEKATLGGNPENDFSKPVRDYKMYILNFPREVLYDRINLRVDKMMQNGLLDEIERLKKMGVPENAQSMQAIAYKEWAENKGLTTDEIVEIIKQNTRHYAKRQLTWFRGYKDAVWIDVHNKPLYEIVDFIVQDYSEVK